MECDVERLSIRKIDQLLALDNNHEGRTRVVSCERGQRKKAGHYWEEKALLAIRSALVVRRPLLILGEPGCGKSQIARAAAELMQREYIPYVVTPDTEAEDIKYRYDAIRRIGEAQALGATKVFCEKTIREKLQHERFIWPGPLWKALNPLHANGYPKRDEVPSHDAILDEISNPASKGVVMHLDEIDKADPSVPNALLEALNDWQFHVSHLNCTVSKDEDAPYPLVIITSNGTRELPSAFMRRCLVWSIDLGEGEPFKAKMKQVVLANFLGQVGSLAAEDQELAEYDAEIEHAIDLLEQDRCSALKQNMPRPGLSELIDYLQLLAHERRYEEIDEGIGGAHEEGCDEKRGQREKREQGERGQRSGIAAQKAIRKALYRQLTYSKYRELSSELCL